MFLEFLAYAFEQTPTGFIPIAGILVAFCYALVRALRHTRTPIGVRLGGVFGVLLVFVSVVLLKLQPVMQLYLEEERGIIFLEADRYTALMRNARYLLYPVGMLVLGFAIFDDRIGAEGRPRTERRRKTGADSDAD